MQNKYLITILLLLSTLVMQGCASNSAHVKREMVLLNNQPIEVLKDLKLDEIKTAALEAVPFARIAAYAYCDKDMHKQLSEEEVIFCKSILENHPAFNPKDIPTPDTKKWTQLLNWNEILTSPIEINSGLQFKAFGRVNNQDVVEIIIGFRGTDFSSLADWRANLRWFNWFLPFRGKDQYELLHDKADQIFKAVKTEATSKLGLHNEVKIYTTGHSLGGGLAQLLAYTGTDNAQVEGAVVFNSSPVTGYENIVLNSEVNCNAKVLRVYERGEILHYVRSGLRMFYRHSPNISEISFSTIHEKRNPILNHSMIKLQMGLE